MRSQLALLMLLVGCAGTTAPPPDTADAPDFTEDYTIGIGDSLRIDVWRNPDLSITDIPVRPDGRISAPLVGDLMVGGKKPEQVAALISEELATYIRDPKVTVIVTNIGVRYRVRVTGAVNKPMTIPYSQDMTVMDVVLEAGGLTEFARPNRTVLYRADGSALTIHLDDILERGDMRTNYGVGPGDTLTVPERVF